MPEYLAPGVYVEEVSFRPKTIEGVSTSTTGFVGPTRFGPVNGEPEILTSFLDFERIYGGIDQLEFTDGDGPSHNDMAHAVRAFFENGGRRLYVARAFEHSAEGSLPDEFLDHGRYTLVPDVSGEEIAFRARYPGAAGNFVVTLVIRLGQNVLTGGRLRGVQEHDTVLVAGGTSELRVVERHVTGDGVRTWLLRDNANDEMEVSEIPVGSTVHVVTMSVIVDGMGQFMSERVWDELRPHPRHRDSLARTFAADPPLRATELYVPLVVDTGSSDSGIEVLEAIAADLTASDSVPRDAAELLSDLAGPNPVASEITFRRQLQEGRDGVRPPATAYEGDEDPNAGIKSGLIAFQDLEDISIVAAPGSTRDSGAGAGYEADSRTIQQLLISHCERMRYRIAVLDSVDRHLVGDVRAYRAEMDSSHAALYYPWVRILDPVTRDEIDVPPSGFVAGIYARNDVERGVHKAPANEVVRLSIGLEQLLNKAQQDVLNPEGVNCLRFFEGRGYRVWGGRTVTSDPEWKYVNLRRFFAFVEHSIDKGTQWAVFEPNGHLLWAKVRRTIEDFLFNEWVSGHLMGETPEEAYFVRCDRSTMTQNDFDNGRLICLVGISPLRPAEFVIFRIGQKTLDFKL